MEGLFASFDKSKPVYFYKTIADCEHMGDVQSAEYEANRVLKPYGAEVVERYWDRRDCGEAYLIVRMSYESARTIVENDIWASALYDPYQRRSDFK